MGEAGADTVAQILVAARARLGDAGIDSADLDARLLFLRASGKDDSWLFANRDAHVSATALRQFEDLLARRANREPVSQILGVREFWSLPFAVTPDVLTPRPDSETLVQAALEGIDDRRSPLRVLDLGTGSGCLLLSLLRELPNAEGLGVDRSEQALAVARENAARLGLADRVHWQAGDWSASLSDTFDLIVSNPPYIETATLAGLDREVSVYEPQVALDGGPDGLTAYRAILADVGRLMSVNSRLLLEIGAGQEDAVARIGEHVELTLSATRRDLAARIRVLEFARVSEG